MKKSIISLGLILALGSLGHSQIQTGRDIAVTNTESGKVRGVIRNGIYTYKGIPYATAKRFESAQKPPALGRSAQLPDLGAGRAFDPTGDPGFR